jgi:hypothetical protein
MSYNSHIDLLASPGTGGGNDKGKGKGKGKANGREEVEEEEDEEEAAAYCDVLLQPGDLLFVPRGWWHFVQAIPEDTDTHTHTHCFSLSFWWDRRKLLP